MKITSYKTKKVVVGDDLYKILDDSLPKLSENDLVVITSKIISITQGDVIKNDGKIQKTDVMKEQAEFYLPQQAMMYGIHLTITNNSFVVSAGVDESNGNGYFILWPKNVQKAVNEIWEYLRAKNKIKHLGIVVTDSKLAPLRMGVTGMGITWAGFKPLRDYVGRSDIFGRVMKVEKLNIVDSISTAAVLVMGEGSEQTPLAVVQEIPDIDFVERVPTQIELKSMTIKPSDDVFGALIKGVKWIRGGGKYSKE